jgi:hypothetical protein
MVALPAGLLAYEDGGQRHVLAVRNDAYADAFMLSTAEARAIELTVLGRSPKQMVDDLGLSLPRVYALRQSALNAFDWGRVIARHKVFRALCHPLCLGCRPFLEHAGED